MASANEEPHYPIRTLASTKSLRPKPYKRPTIISNVELEDEEIFLKRSIKKSDQTRRSFWFLAFPHLPLTRKPNGIRMGKGKGSVDHYVAKVQKGSMILEIKSSLISKAYTALLVAKSKFSLNVCHEKEIKIKWK